MSFIQDEVLSQRKLIGIDGPSKPFPVIVERNKHLFRAVRSVIEIGSGRGRFIKWFMKNFPNIEVYVAIEPYKPFTEKYPKWKALRVLNTYWENVKYKMLTKRFDVVIFWDTLMFMRGDPIRITEEMLPMVRKYFLFSLYPIKSGLYDTRTYRAILRYFDNHSQLRLIDKAHWNRLYEIVK